MVAKSNPRSSRKKLEDEFTFDVTCVIGSVTVGPRREEGEDSPFIAAARLIEAHDTPGTFTFPGPHGKVTVHVEREVEHDWRESGDRDSDYDIES